MAASLGAAVRDKNVSEIVRLIDECGASPSGLDMWGYSPLCLSIALKCEEAAMALIRRGANVNEFDSRDYRSPLIAACAVPMPRVVDELIARGADVNARAKSGAPCTPLAVACLSGHRGVVEALLNAGADHTFVHENGQTMMHFAAKSMRIEAGLVDLLCRLDSSRWSAEDSLCDTPLMTAVRIGNVSAINAFIDAGCPINVSTSKMQHALGRAASQGSIEIVNLLLRRGASLSDANKQSSPTIPLLQSALSGGTDEKMARYLLRVGASPRGVKLTYDFSWVHFVAMMPMCVGLLDDLLFDFDIDPCEVTNSTGTWAASDAPDADIMHRLLVASTFAALSSMIT